VFLGFCCVFFLYPPYILSQQLFGKNYAGIGDCLRAACVVEGLLGFCMFFWAVAAKKIHENQDKRLLLCVTSPPLYKASTLLHANF